MFRSIHTFAELAPAKRKAALDVVFLLPLYAAFLPVLGFNRTMAMAARRKSGPARSAGIEADVYARIVKKVADRLFPGTRCLVRSLVLLHLLRRAGVPSELRIGVVPREGRIGAHAWVESAGVVLNDTPDVDSRFRPLEASRASSVAEWM